jgi:hypothetical protein
MICVIVMTLTDAPGVIGFIGWIYPDIQVYQYKKGIGTLQIVFHYSIQKSITPIFNLAKHTSGEVVLEVNYGNKGNRL